MRSYGLIQSPPDIKSEKLSVSGPLPPSLELENTGGVYDQGSDLSCFAYALASTIYWRHWVMGHDKRFREIKDRIWSLREKREDGMVPYHTLKKMQTQEDDVIGIGRFAKIDTIESVKTALFLNGPVVIGIIVKNENSTDIWNGSGNFGGHAMTVTGYDRDRFLIKNSWGFIYGSSGYAYMSKEDFVKNVIECWTIMM